MKKEYVFINEVGPRDGLQNQDINLSEDKRLGLIHALEAANIPGIEVASFVSSKAIPQMQGAKGIVKNLKPSNCEYSVLIPNIRGYKDAIEAGCKIISVIPAATEEMNKKNINMSLKQALDIASEIINLGKQDNIITRAYIAVAWVCPYEGKVDESVILKIADQLIEAGADELVLADTIGAANPASVKSLVSKVVDRYPVQISAHFHDTRAMALANVWSSLEVGIRKFDSCIGGLGGCPFAPGASGNLATEDIVHMLHQANYETGINTNALLSAIEYASNALGNKIGGRMTPWLNQQSL